jgi:hypothetical protein
MVKFAGMGASLDAIFLSEGIEDEAHLLDLTSEFGTASIGGESR